MPTSYSSVKRKAGAGGSHSSSSVKKAKKGKASSKKASRSATKSKPVEDLFDESASGSESRSADSETESEPADIRNGDANDDVGAGAGIDDTNPPPKQAKQKKKTSRGGNAVARPPTTAAALKVFKRLPVVADRLRMEGIGKKIAGIMHKGSRAGIEPFLLDDSKAGNDTDLRRRIAVHEEDVFRGCAANEKKMFFSNSGVRYISRQYRNMRASDHSNFVSTLLISIWNQHRAHF